MFIIILVINVMSAKISIHNRGDQGRLLNYVIPVCLYMLTVSICAWAKAAVTLGPEGSITNTHSSNVESEQLWRILCFLPVTHARCLASGLWEGLNLSASAPPAQEEMDGKRRVVYLLHAECLGEMEECCVAASDKPRRARGTLLDAAFHTGTKRKQQRPLTSKFIPHPV